MELAVYRASQYESAMEAFSQGGIYTLRNLSHCHVTLKMLENAGCEMEPDFHIALDSAEKSFECAGDDSYRFVVMDNLPRFEMDRDGGNEVWQKVETFEYECEKSSQHLETLNCNVELVPESDGCFTVIFISTNGNTYDRKGVEVSGEYDIRLDGETFDFRLKHSDEDGYWVDVFNLVDGDDGRTTNYTFEYYKDAVVVSPDYLLRKAIANELDQIEKYSGEAYCGPLCNEAGSEGDEIFQALHAIRKLIKIGVDSYDKEVKRAQEIEALEIVDGTLGDFEVHFVGAGDDEYGILDTSKENTFIVERDFDTALDAEHFMKEHYIKTVIDPKYK